MQNRRSFLMQLGAVTAGGLLLPSKIMANKGYQHITILHTNDMHSQLEPFDKDHPRYANKGGMGRISALVKQIRKENENVLLLDSGDFSQGTPYYNYFKGEAVIKLMSVMGYNASIIGNHEFDNGVEQLYRALLNANFPILSSNYRFEHQGMANLVQKSLIVKKGGMKIGLYALGIDLHALVSADNIKGVKVEEQIETALHYESYLKSEGCDVIVCLSHLGNKNEGEDMSDWKIAQSTLQTDLILGGHSHTFLDKPQVLKNASGNDVLVNQVGWGALMLGRIDLFFNGADKELVVNYNSDNRFIG